MPISLKAAGLTQRPPFIKAADLAELEIQFVILNATDNPNGYGGRREVLFTLRCVNVHPEAALFDANGVELTALPKLSMSMGWTPSRGDYADYFRLNEHPQSLGPLVIQKIPSRDPQKEPFLSIIDYVPLVANGAPIDQADRQAQLVADRADRAERASRNQRQVASATSARSVNAARDDIKDLPF